MQRKQNSEVQVNESVYIAAEKDANIFNLNCLAILCVFAIISEILSELGVFSVPLIVMRISTVFAFVSFSTPLFVFEFFKRIKKDDGKILEREKFKYLIITSTYIGIGILCVTLSFHAIILLAIPPLVAAQYKGQKNLYVWIMLATLLLVPIGVYGSFFLGTVDRNFVKGMITDEEFLILANRITIATSQRMWELFIHYALPRLFGVIAIVLLVFGITQRNGKMLKKQAELDNKVNMEMQRITKMQSHVIDILATLIETRDVGTGEHVIRTKKYVGIIANELRKHDKFASILTNEEITRIENAAPLHDVGKIVVSDTILLKPGKLTPEEFDMMKIHTTKGGKVIRDLFADIEDEEFLRTAEQIAMYHHEKWNGAGYPKGLKGEEIPLPARIMAVADVFDALVSVRVYKKAIPASEALDIMMEESGTHFDPEIMKIVNENLRDELIRVSQLPLSKIR